MWIINQFHIGAGPFSYVSISICSQRSDGPLCSKWLSHTFSAIEMSERMVLEKLIRQTRHTHTRTHDGRERENEKWEIILVGDRDPHFNRPVQYVNYFNTKSSFMLTVRNKNEIWLIWCVIWPVCVHRFTLSVNIYIFVHKTINKWIYLYTDENMYSLI